MNANHAMAAALAIQTAEDKTLLALVEAGFRQLGLREIEGIPLSDWIEQRRTKELEKHLLDCGDKNPALHDAIQASIAEAVRKSGAA